MGNQIKEQFDKINWISLGIQALLFLGAGLAFLGGYAKSLGDNNYAPKVETGIEISSLREQALRNELGVQENNRKIESTASDAKEAYVRLETKLEAYAAEQKQFMLTVIERLPERSN